MPKVTKNTELKKFADLCVLSADKMKAEDIVLLKMSQISSITDYFLICAGNSTPHINAISEKIQDDVRINLSKKPLSISGDANSGWIVLDYGPIMVHIFSKPMREKYNLEQLWNDAKIAKTPLTKVRKKIKK